jgi:hypothetical protein
LQGSQVVVRDLFSTNGTFLDTQRIQNAEIRNGQILMLGSMEMRLLVTPVEIAIPPLPPPAEPVPTTLADGTAVSADYNKAYFQYSKDGGTSWSNVAGAINVAAGDSTLLVKTDTYQDLIDESAESGEKEEDQEDRMKDLIW